VGQAADGAAGQPQSPADGAQADVLADQGMDGRVLLADAVRQAPGPAGLSSGDRQGHRLAGTGGRRRWFGQQGAVLEHGLLDGVGEVLPEVEPVGDVDGPRGAEPPGLSAYSPFGPGRYV